MNIIPHHQAAAIQRAMRDAALALVSNDLGFERLCAAADRDPALRRLRDQVRALRDATGAMSGAQVAA